MHVAAHQYLGEDMTHLLAHPEQADRFTF